MDLWGTLSLTSIRTLTHWSLPSGCDHPTTFLSNSPLIKSIFLQFKRKVLWGTMSKINYFPSFVHRCSHSRVVCFGGIFKGHFVPAINRDIFNLLVQSPIQPELVPVCEHICQILSCQSRYCTMASTFFSRGRHSPLHLSLFHHCTLVTSGYFLAINSFMDHTALERSTKLVTSNSKKLIMLPVPPNQSIYLH